MDYQRLLLRLGAALTISGAQLACLPLPEATDTSASGGESSSVGTDGSITASSTSAGATTGVTTSSSGGTTAGMVGTVGTVGSTSDGSSSDGSTTACNFICDDPTCGDGEARVLDPELGFRCSIGPCDAWAQDCPEGEKCAAYSEGGTTWDELLCAPIQGDAEPGEPCTVAEEPLSGLDTCELGAMCWSVDEESLEGVCVGLCDGSPEEPTCAEPGTSCRITNEGVLNLCLPDCTPLGQECAEGDACVFVDDGFSCVPGGEQGVGEACTGSTCMDGQLCLPAPYLPECLSESCCTPYCEALGDDPCPELEGSSCIPFFMEGEAPEGLEELGFCAFHP